RALPSRDGTEVAPRVHHMPLLDARRALTNRDGAVVGPGLQSLGGECELRAREVPRGRFEADAGAAATRDLICETGALAPFEPEQLREQAMLTRPLAERAARVTLAAIEAEAVADRPAVIERDESGGGPGITEVPRERL